MLLYYGFVLVQMFLRLTNGCSMSPTIWFTVQADTVSLNTNSV